MPDGKAKHHQFPKLFAASGNNKTIEQTADNGRTGVEHADDLLADGCRNDA